ncbi:MAG: hypothetical protein Q9226_001839 [Calogaya cf. arnoldii]
MRNRSSHGGRLSEFADIKARGTPIPSSCPLQTPYGTKVVADDYVEYSGLRSQLDKPKYQSPTSRIPHGSSGRKLANEENPPRTLMGNDLVCQDATTLSYSTRTMAMGRSLTNLDIEEVFNKKTAALCIGWASLSVPLAESLEKSGFDLEQSILNMFGGVCTTELAEFAGKPTELTSLMILECCFAKAVSKIVKQQGSKPLLSHNAANNTIAYIKVALALIFQSSIWDDKYFQKAEKDIAKGSEPVPHLMDDLLEDPLDVRPNTVIMSFDGESHDRLGQHHNTEWGVAWLDLEKVKRIKPGIFGINWHRYIEARHFRNWLYSGHRLKSIVVARLGPGFQYGERRSEDASEAVLPALVLSWQRKQRVVHTGSSERGHSFDANPITYGFFRMASQQSGFSTSRRADCPEKSIHTQQSSAKRNLVDIEAKIRGRDDEFISSMRAETKKLTLSQSPTYLAVLHPF